MCTKWVRSKSEWKGTRIQSSWLVHEGQRRPLVNSDKIHICYISKSIKKVDAKVDPECLPCEKVRKQEKTLALLHRQNLRRKKEISANILSSNLRSHNLRRLLANVKNLCSSALLSDIVVGCHSGGNLGKIKSNPSPNSQWTDPKKINVDSIGSFDW